MQIVIREAASADLSGILALYAQPDMDGGEMQLPAEAERNLARTHEYPFYKVFVAIQAERVVGTFELLIMHNLAHQGRPSGIVEDVVVAADLQGRGIGGEMMRHAMELCRQEGCYKMVLSSNLRRERAHAFYESLGFRKHGYSFLVEL